MRLLFICLILSCVVSGTAGAESAEPSGLGFRGSLGTDVELGIGYGVGGSYLIDRPDSPNMVEIGVDFYYHNSSETTDETVHTYEEEIWLTVFAARINLLMDYEPFREGTYFILGIGLASVAVEWEERSDTDTSLGPYLDGGGSMQSAEGTIAAAVLNFGVGRNFANALEGRVELPILVAFDDVGDAASVMPTITVSLGKRF